MNTNEIELITQKISTAFSTLSEKAGVATDYFWPILIKQEFYSGLASLLAWSAFTGISAFILFRIKDKTLLGDKDRCGDRMPTRYMFITILLWGFIFAACIEATTGLEDGGLINWIGRLFNPEYYALRNILTLIK